MAEQHVREIGLREARAVLGDIAHAAAADHQVTYLTSHGRRLAAVVPARDPLTDAAEPMTDEDLELARAWAETAEPYPVKRGYLTLLGEIDRLREAAEAERTARLQMIQMLDEVVSESNPDLRDSLMIQLGTSGLLPLAMRHTKTMLTVKPPADAPIEVVRWHHEEQQ